MTPHQTSILRALAARGAMSSASLASATSLSIVGTTRALQALRDAGCVDRQDGGYWHLTVIGAETLKVAI